MVHLLTVHNNGDGTYLLTFDAPIIADTTGYELQFGLYTPSGGGWIFQIATSDAPDGNTIIIQELNGDADCTRFVMLDQPSTFHSTSPFEVASPQHSI